MFAKLDSNPEFKRFINPISFTFINSFIFGWSQVLDNLGTASGGGGGGGGVEVHIPLLPFQIEDPVARRLCTLGFPGRVAIQAVIQVSRPHLILYTVKFKTPTCSGQRYLPAPLSVL